MGCWLVFVGFRVRSSTELDERLEGCKVTHLRFAENLLLP